MSLHGQVATSVGGAAGRAHPGVEVGLQDRPGVCRQEPVALLAVLDAERGHKDANISTIGDAMWWTISTLTTVGYGDRYPRTTAGRLVAVGLMVAGIALLGTVTATLATWFSAAVAEESEAATDDLVAEVRELRLQVGVLYRPRPSDDAASTHRGQGPSMTPARHGLLSKLASMESSISATGWDVIPPG